MSIAPIITAYATPALTAQLAAASVPITQLAQETLQPELNLEADLAPGLLSHTWNGMRGLMRQARFYLTGAAVTISSLLYPSPARAQAEETPPIDEIYGAKDTPIAPGGSCDHTTDILLAAASYAPSLARTAVFALTLGGLLLPRSVKLVTEETLENTGALNRGNYAIGRIATHWTGRTVAHARNAAVTAGGGYLVRWGPLDLLGGPTHFLPALILTIGTVGSWVPRFRAWREASALRKAGVPEEMIRELLAHRMGIIPRKIDVKSFIKSQGGGAA